MTNLQTKPLSEARTPGTFLPLEGGPDDAETSLVAGAPGDSAAPDLAANALYRRAVEAAIWGMPLVNFDALRQAYFSDAGAILHDVIFWSEPPSWKFQAPTPDISARHAMFFVNVKDEPIVVEVPPAGKAALSGTLVDSWNLPLADVGAEGADKGKGAKYLLLPPEHEARHPQGFLPVRSTTHNVYGLLRLTPKSDSDEDLDEAIAYLKQLRIYPLWGGMSARRSRFIDMVHRKFEGTAPWDASFYAALARMVAEEPVKPRDQSMMGLLHAIGIGRDLALQPDVAAENIFRHAIVEAHAFMAQGRRKGSSGPWPGRGWRLRASEGGAFVANDHVLVDDRAFAFFGSFGLRRDATAGLHLETFVDERGDALDGSRAYQLRVPADLPASSWSVASYDSETNAFVREAPAVGFDSRDPALERNDDGSVDLHFAPKPPRNRDTNWIATAEGRPFFLVFRIQDPGERTDWSLDDVEPIA